MSMTDDRVVNTNGHGHGAPCPDCQARKRHEGRIQRIADQVAESAWPDIEPIVADLDQAWRIQVRINEALRQAVADAIRLTVKNG